jgi:transposase
MEKSTTYVALDDSKRKIVAGILRPGDAQPELREIANDPRQIRRLFERLKREGPVAACYEAGVSGYDLHRQITALGVACAVIAPALTPRRPGQRIKTDRRDAAKLVRLFRAGELTAIHVLDESEEAVRDLVRCRDDIRRDGLRWRHRVLKLLARHGHAYRRWRGKRNSTRSSRPLPPPRPIVSPSAGSAASGGSTRCWRSSSWPRWWTSRASAGRANSHARRVLVEAAWHYRHRPTIGRALASRSQGQPDEIVGQAWRAQQRLPRRYRHLVGHGKRTPVAVAAIARELVGFIWAAMTRHESRRQAA